jgi:alpha,alpha-trehalose phosphorylase
MGMAPQTPMVQTPDWPVALTRRFSAIIFDWDGTAVPDRQSDATALAIALSQVLTMGTRCAIITGTKLEHIESQCTSLIPKAAKSNLFVCANRGSEVFGFGPGGEPILLFRYSASHEENQALDTIALSICKELQARGLQTEIIFDRLNRRKIDLIPTERWKDPKKAEFLDLLAAVESRLNASGIVGGVSHLIELSRRIAIAHGLTQSRITSDIKHIEVGLTDKADSVRWLKEHVLDPQEVAGSQIIVFGDEFGSVGGVSGSDSLMRLPELGRALLVSVGVEPEGVPSGVAHLPGGPPRLIEFLRLQSELADLGGTRLSSLVRDQEPSWILEQEGFDPSREGEMEALFALGNGRLGVRGASNLSIPSSQPDLFVAGVYDRKASVLPYSELEFMTTERPDDPFCELVPIPSPLPFRLWVDDQEFSPGSESMRKHTRRLDLERAISLEQWDFEDTEGRRTRISCAELVSLPETSLLLQEIEIVCSHGQNICIDTRLTDPDTDLKYPHLRLSHPDKICGLSDCHRFETKSSGVQITLSTRMLKDRLSIDDPVLRFPAEPGQATIIRKFASVQTTVDVPRSLPRSSTDLVTLDWATFDRLTQAHTDAWRQVWNRADVQFHGDPATTQAQRFNLYHLRIAADQNPRVSPGARGLTGRAYEGHVFWDSEIFLLPFYIHCFPEIARSILQYRYETLPGAQRRAVAQGYLGACYAWESTRTGDDVTPTKIHLKGTEQVVPIFTGPQQIHVTADVAYGIRRYWLATGDDEFLFRSGVEILLETARFWQSRVERLDGKFHIRGVVGPDEYHHGVDDNAYTNWMAKFNLETAVWASSWMKDRNPVLWKELSTKLSLDPKEPASWTETANDLYIPKPNSDGVIEQFRGFFQLERPHLDPEELLRTPLARLFAWEKVNQQQLIKQADVLMIPFLFPKAFSKEVLLANYRYYEPITDHGSSLSPCVHSGIAARVGAWEDARRFWKLGLELDLTNRMRNTPLGIHLANMGGCWQSLVFHFLGIEWDQKVFKEDPGYQIHIPAEADWIAFHLLGRGRSHAFKIPADRERSLLSGLRKGA